jgi:hypothetical protein
LSGHSLVILLLAEGMTKQDLDPIGWSATSVLDQTAACYAEVLVELAAALVLWRHAEQPARPGRAGPATPWPAPAPAATGSGAARSVLEQAPIVCAGCAQPFDPEDDEERRRVSTCCATGLRV